MSQSMNRKQRRAAEKAGKKVEKDPVITIKKSELDRIKAQAADLAIEQAFHLMLAIPCLVHRDHDGYGKVRLERFVDLCLQKFDLFQTGHFCLEDFHQILYDECGVQIREVEFLTTPPSKTAQASFSGFFGRPITIPQAR